jgi:hypothetical protein
MLFSTSGTSKLTPQNGGSSNGYVLVLRAPSAQDAAVEGDCHLLAIRKVFVISSLFEVFVSWEFTSVKFTIARSETVPSAA